MPTTQVTIGGKDYSVPPINTRKLTVGASIWAHLQEHINEAMMEVARFSRHYGELNKLPITRERNARHQYGFTEADFQGRPFIEVPSPPSIEQQLAVGISYVYERAEDDVARLCALVLAPRQEVREHRKAGDLQDWLLEQGQDLIDEAEPEEMIDLLVAVVQQFKARKKFGDAVGKLRAEFSSQESQESSEAENSDSSTQPEHRQTAVKVAEVTDERPTENPQSGKSSTSSPPDTIGQPTSSLTSSPGAMS
jgi:hypothetical protein